MNDCDLQATQIRCGCEIQIHAYFSRCGTGIPGIPVSECGTPRVTSVTTDVRTQFKGQTTISWYSFHFMVFLVVEHKILLKVNLYHRCQGFKQSGRPKTQPPVSYHSFIMCYIELQHTNAHNSTSPEHI